MESPKTDPPYLKLVSDKPCEEPDDFTTEIKPNSRHDCQHKRMLVDPTLRRVTCQTCGEALDPIECILVMCRYDMDLDWRVKQIAEFQSKQAAKDAAIRAAHRKPMTDLLGKQAAGFVACSGHQWMDKGKRVWIETFHDPKTGTKVAFSKDGRFWKSAGNRSVEITKDEALKAVATCS